MLTILVLFVGLTLATAVIAYWSDNLGKKLGKKRVSLWGLRPRTTATFLTIASSWLIMVFTLGVLLTIFPPLRQSLLRFDEVQAKEQGLRKSTRNLSAQLVDLNAQKDALTVQATRASAKLEEVQGTLAQSRVATTKARQARQAAQTEAGAARKNAAAALKRQQTAAKREKAALGNLRQVSKQLGATQKQRQTAQQQLRDAQIELKGANAQVKSANARVKAADARVSAANAQVARADAQFARAQAQLATVQLSLDKAKASEKLAVANAETARQNAEESKRLAQVADERAATANQKRIEADKGALVSLGKSVQAEAKILEAEKRVAQLQEQSEDLRRANQLALQTNDLVSAERDYILGSTIRVSVGFTLVARTFESGATFSEATDDLRALFGRAADQVVPGFLPGARLELAPRVVPAPNVSQGDENVRVVVQDDEIYNGLATAISRSQTPLSVRLIADRNYLEGEQTLKVRFIVVPVRPALPANAELASANFDPKIGDAKLFSSLLKLVDIGREVAGQNGVTPPLAPETPDFYAPGSNEQIFQTLRKISAFEAPVRVRIVTAAPISTADQLRVRFEVEPVAASAPTTQALARQAPPAT